MKIGTVDLSQDIYVIAEIGGNHGGDAELAHKMVEAAAKTGVDAVKFQSFRAEQLVHPDLEANPILRRHFKTQVERFKALELDWTVYEALFRQCEELGVDFITTPFDPDLMDEFAPHMPAIKVASGDLTYHRLVRRAAATGKPVLLSTGASDLTEIAAAAAHIPVEQRILLHCTAVYPLPPEQAQISAVTAMRAAFPDSVIGYSDHTIGLDAATCAMTLGARVVEKHFTLDKSWTPGDHVLSADPTEMGELVRRARMIPTLLGSSWKVPTETEVKTMRRAIRRGLYAARDLTAGTVLRESDLLVVRPADGLSADQLDAVVGKRLISDIQARKPLEPEHIG